MSEFDSFQEEERYYNKLSSEKYINSISNQISKSKADFFNTAPSKQIHYDALVLWCIENEYDYVCKGWYTTIDIRRNEK